MLGEKLSKNITFKQKLQVKVKSRSKVVPVFVFYLWRHLWQTFRIAAKFLYNSSLNRSKRFLTLDQDFNQSSWKLLQMESACSKTLKIQNFCRMFGTRCEIGPLMTPISKVLQNSFKIIYRDQTTTETSTLLVIFIFKRPNQSL